MNFGLKLENSLKANPKNIFSANLFFLTCANRRKQLFVSYILNFNIKIYANKSIKMSCSEMVASLLIYNLYYYAKTYISQQYEILNGLFLLDVILLWMFSSTHFNTALSYRQPKCIITNHTCS